MKKNNGFSRSPLDRFLRNFGLRRKRRNKLQVFTLTLEPKGKCNEFLESLVEVE